MADLPSRISIREVGPRDGLQNEAPISTDAKVAFIDALVGTGLRRIEAVSFVHPVAIPQMADAEEVWARIDHASGIEYSALVPNLRGTQRALQAGVRQLEVVISASDRHNRENLNCSTDESLAELDAVVRTGHDAGATCQMIVATSFGCPFEGNVPVARIVRVVREALAVGVDGVSLADTTGMATPGRVTSLVEAVRSQWPDLALNLHLHNTRGTGLANVLAGLHLGVTDFDASVGGLGGCPYAPDATGNIATEELVHMVEDMGIDTGVDLDALLEVARGIEVEIGRPLPSLVLRAGPRSRLHEVAP